MVAHKQKVAIIGSGNWYVFFFFLKMCENWTDTSQG